MPVCNPCSHALAATENPFPGRFFTRTFERVTVPPRTTGALIGGRARRGRLNLLKPILLGGAVLASGCAMIGPDFEKPAAPVQDEWQPQDSEIVTSSPSELESWWSAFADETLDGLIEQAVRQNLPLQIAGIRIFEARAQLGIATGRQYPQIQEARGAVSRTELSENSANFNPLIDDSFSDASLGFDAAWELDIWGRFRRGVEAADANFMAEVAGYDDALVSVTAEVASVYVAIRTFEARLAIARENVTIQERSLRIATVRFENGATTALDVEQAKTLLANTRATIPLLEIGLRQAQNALNTLLGVSPGTIGPFPSGTGEIPAAPAAIAIGIPADLLRRRPDIRRAELQAAAQSALIGVAKADLYPQFSLAGTVGLRSSDTGVSDLGDLFDGDSIEAGVGPSFRWNILNYGRIKNAVRVEDARFQQAVVNYENTVLRAATEVENALVAFVQGQRRVAHLADSVKAARRSVDLALVQYRDGTVAYTRVLDTQTFLVSQQDLYTDARGRVIRDLVATYKALGGGWQIRDAAGILQDAVRNDMDSRTDWGRSARVRAAGDAGARSTDAAQAGLVSVTRPLSAGGIPRRAAPRRGCSCRDRRDSPPRLKRPSRVTEPSETERSMLAVPPPEPVIVVVPPSRVREPEIVPVRPSAVRKSPGVVSVPIVTCRFVSIFPSRVDSRIVRDAPSSKSVVRVVRNPVLPRSTERSRYAL